MFVRLARAAAVAFASPGLCGTRPFFDKHPLWPLFRVIVLGAGWGRDYRPLLFVMIMF
jgi:hypothetical protein